jgi:hypothetical protein
VIPFSVLFGKEGASTRLRASREIERQALLEVIPELEHDSAFNLADFRDIP